MNLHICKVRHACEKHSITSLNCVQQSSNLGGGKNKRGLICQNSCCQNPVPRLSDKKQKANEEAPQALNVLKKEVASHWEEQKKLHGKAGI